MNLPRELEQKILSTPGVVVTTYAPAEPPPEDAKSLAQSEKEFQAQVIQFARDHHWNLIYHTYDSRKSAKGFLDLVLVRGRVVWIELKVEPRVTTTEQDDWIAGLREAGQEVYVFYPRDWPQIMEVLK